MNRRETRSWLRVAGQDLETRLIPGDPTRATLVFLHEGLGSVSTWRGFPRELAAVLGCPALVYSRAGYGRSDPVELPRPLDYMQQEGSRLLPQLLDQAGIAGPLLLFGHSDGASIALVYASTEHGRARTQGLILEAPHVFCEERSVQAIELARTRYLEQDLRQRLARHHRNVDVAFWGWNRAWLDPAFRGWSLTHYLPRVSAPSLLIQSEHDPYGSLNQLDTIEARTSGPTRRLVLADCGHAPHRDQPKAVIAASARFVATLVG